MATLDELLKIEGVVAAGEFTADGKSVDYKSKMDMLRQMAAMTAQYCATVKRQPRPTSTGCFRRSLAASVRALRDA